MRILNLNDVSCATLTQSSYVSSNMEVILSPDEVQQLRDLSNKCREAGLPFFVDVEFKVGGCNE